MTPRISKEKVPLPTSAEGTATAPRDESMILKRWTRDEYQALLKSELIGKKHELIEGYIVEKMGQDRKHALGVLRSQKWLSQLFGTEYVQSQAPTLADTSNEPEPDVAVFQQKWEAYSDSPPASEARLFVEVTNATQTQDRQVKRKVYVRNGVPEYWILDITKRTLTVHREPLADEYAQINILTELQTVTPLAAPDGTTPIIVADLLAPLGEETATDTE